MIYNVEILRISPNFMDFFYPRFQDSAYVYTPLALKNEDFSSNLTIPFKTLFFLGVIKVIFVEELGKCHSCSFAETLYGNDFGIFCSSFNEVVNSRGRHSAA